MNLLLIISLYRLSCFREERAIKSKWGSNLVFPLKVYFYLEGGCYPNPSLQQ